jgi:glycerol-3-phosphate acyltransferase PlsX
VVEGVNQALATFPDIEIQLYGDEAKIKHYLTAKERVSIVHTTEKINSDDEPVKAIRRKKEASMVLATKAVKDGQADAVLSAGNTGALLAAGVFVVGRIKHIDRPGLMSTLPTMDGKGFDMMDLKQMLKIQLITSISMVFLAHFTRSTCVVSNNLVWDF